MFAGTPPPNLRISLGLRGEGQRKTTAQPVPGWRRRSEVRQSNTAAGLSSLTPLGPSRTTKHSRFRFQKSPVTTNFASPPRDTTRRRGCFALSRPRIPGLPLGVLKQAIPAESTIQRSGGIGRPSPSAGKKKQTAQSQSFVRSVLDLEQSVSTDFCHFALCPECSASNASQPD